MPHTNTQRWIPTSSVQQRDIKIACPTAPPSPQPPLRSPSGCFFPKRPPGSFRGERTAEQERTGKHKRGEGRARERLGKVLGEAGTHTMQTALENRRQTTHPLCALSLEEKDHRGVRVPVSGVFGVCYRVIFPPAAPAQISRRRDSPSVREAQLSLRQLLLHPGQAGCPEEGCRGPRWRGQLSPNTTHGTTVGHYL